jgi:hypothetical protein
MRGSMHKREVERGGEVEITKTATYYNTLNMPQMALQLLIINVGCYATLF